MTVTSQGCDGAEKCFRPIFVIQLLLGSRWTPFVTQHVKMKFFLKVKHILTSNT